jgi:hypothetical protein
VISSSVFFGNICVNINRLHSKVSGSPNMIHHRAEHVMAIVPEVHTIKLMDLISQYTCMSSTESAIDPVARPLG